MPTKSHHPQWKPLRVILRLHSLSKTCYNARRTPSQRRMEMEKLFPSWVKEEGEKAPLELNHLDLSGKTLRASAWHDGRCFSLSVSAAPKNAWEICWRVTQGDELRHEHCDTVSSSALSQNGSKDAKDAFAAVCSESLFQYLLRLLEVP